MRQHLRLINRRSSPSPPEARKGRLEEAEHPYWQSEMSVGRKTMTVKVEAKEGAEEQLLFYRIYASNYQLNSP